MFENADLIHCYTTPTHRKAAPQQQPTDSRTAGRIIRTIQAHGERRGA